MDIEVGLIQSVISATAELVEIWLGGQITSNREKAKECGRKVKLRKTPASQGVPV